MIDNKHNFHGKHVLALLIVLLLAPLRALNADETAVSHAQPLCTKFATVYQWDNRQLISDAPALMKLPDGTLLCSVQLWSRDDAIVPERYGRNRCLIFASVDEGSTWQERSRIPFNTGKFLLHNGLLYFIGSGIKWQGLHITSSSDRGKTWSNPVQLRNGKVYAASTGWVCSDNTLYWAADDMNRSVKDRAVFAFSCDLSRDPLDAASWRFSNDERHPGLPQSLGKGRHNGGKWLEPNVVDLDGKLLVIVRVRASQGVVDGVVPNMAAICSLEETENDELTLEFSHYYPFPGAQNQFHIIKDEERELFWMTSNQVTGKATDSYRGWGKERRFLMLHYSRDAQNWFPAGVLAMWRKETQAFNYCTPLIDGNDLLFVSRTSHNAANQHDNDCITFHRLENFRKTAVDLQPGESASEVAKLPAFQGSTPGVKREIDMPLVDLSQDKQRHSVVAAGTESVYQGHCDTVLLPDGKTMFTAWCLGHAQWIGPIAKSSDAGRTWSKPLDTPKNWRQTSNTPALHRLVAPDGGARLFCFADGLDWSRQGKPPYPMHQSYSEDNGQTWTPMAPNGVESEVPPKTIHAFDEGMRLVMWGDLPGYVVQSESLDGGLTWSPSRQILRVPSRWSQPCVIRSADGGTHLMLLRENSRKYQSLYSVSHDDAKTWSEPRELPATLTGDRHVAKFAPDGRLVVAFRDVAKSSPTYGHYLAWVGRFEDIIQGKPGDYRVKLFHNALRKESDKPGTGNADCGYSDLELLPDGTIVATTYLKYAAGLEKHSVMNTRFTLTETDSLAKEHLKAR